MYTTPEENYVTKRRVPSNSNPERSASAKLRIHTIARQKFLGKGVLDELQATSQEARGVQAELDKQNPNRHRRKNH